MKEVKRTSKVKGIYYVTYKVSSYRYMKVIHEKSGLLIVHFRSPVEKVTEVMEAVDKVLSKVNWNVSAKSIGNRHMEAVRELNKKVVIDESTGKYVVKN